jgi:hypothetical protein
MPATAKIIDFESYRSQKRDAGAQAASLLPYAYYWVVWVPVFFWPPGAM